MNYKHSYFYKILFDCLFFHYCDLFVTYFLRRSHIIIIFAKAIKNHTDMATTENRLSKIVDDNGKSQIIVKVNIARDKRPCIKSGIYIIPKYFKQGEDRKYNIVPPKKGKLNLLEYNDTATAKTELSNLCSRIVKICQVTEKEKMDVTKESIEVYLNIIKAIGISDDDITYKRLNEEIEKQKIEETTTVKKLTFFEMVETYIEKKQFSYDYTHGVRVMVRDVARYQEFIRITDKKRKDFTFDIDTVTKDDIEGYIDFIRNEKALSEEYPKIFEKLLNNYPSGVKKGQTVLYERGDNTIIKLIKKLKGFFTWLYDTERTKNRPFDGIKIGTEKFGTPFYITIEERNQIADFDFSFSKHLSAQRDIFIFQCLIGCRVGDLYRLTADNIINGILMYTPHKTKDEGDALQARVPLHPRASTLIEKYTDMDKQGRLFPFISSQKYNDAIKEIFTQVGITRNVEVRNATTGENEIKPMNEIASSHLARRTFVGNAYKQVSDPNIIGKMSGHVEGSKAFARYRNIEDETLKDIINKLG